VVRIYPLRLFYTGRDQNSLLLIDYAAPLFEFGKHFGIRAAVHMEHLEVDEAQKRRIILHIIAPDVKRRQSRKAGKQRYVRDGMLPDRQVLQVFAIAQAYPSIAFPAPSSPNEMPLPGANSPLWNSNTANPISSGGTTHCSR
jgi:hypothetical protein